MIKAFRFYIRDLVPNTIAELWRPHVVIYLDKSPEECLKSIKENGKVIFFDFITLFSTEVIFLT
jgi:hypothetical protein